MLSNSSGELPSTSEYGTAGYTFGCLEGGRRVESYSKMSIPAMHTTKGRGVPYSWLKR
jgi:hypothetical protein